MRKNKLRFCIFLRLFRFFGYFPFSLRLLRPRETPRKLPRPPQGKPKASQNDRAPPLTPKGHPRRPRWPPRGAEVVPRGPKDLPKAFKRHPRRPRKPPRGPPRGAQVSPRRDFRKTYSHPTLGQTIFARHMPTQLWVSTCLVIFE